MINIHGLDKLQKDLDDLQNILSNLDGELGSVRFDPHNPSSIEGAIQFAKLALILIMVLLCPY